MLSRMVTMIPNCWYGTDPRYSVSALWHFSCNKTNRSLSLGCGRTHTEGSPSCSFWPNRADKFGIRHESGRMRTSIVFFRDSFCVLFLKFKNKGTYM